MSEPITEWISGEFTLTRLSSYVQVFLSDFTHRCLSAPEGGTPNSPTPTPLLREWAKATLAGRSWKDALVVSASVSVFFALVPLVGLTLGVDSEFVAPRFTIYRVICERLETIHHITHASECFRQMANELAREVQGKDHPKWVLGEWSCL